MIMYLYTNSLFYFIYQCGVIICDELDVNFSISNKHVDVK